MASPDDIRQMDGPALTELAYQLGLSPHSPEGKPYRQGGTVTESFPSCRDGTPWQPHKSPRQADAVLRAMRQRGDITDVYAGADFGRVVMKPSVRTFPDATSRDSILTLWGVGEPGTPADTTEAVAVLRCAVLVITRMSPGLDNGD